MKLFTSKNNLELANKICKNLNIPLGKLRIEKFSDGEMLPVFEETVRDKNVFFLQSTTSSDSFMETFLTIDAAKRSGCKSFTLVSPFQGYSRQDKTENLRTSIGSKMVADILEKVGVNKIITIDLHAHAIQGFYNVPVIHLNGNKIFIDYIKSLNIDNLTIMAPDQGAVKRASYFCKAFPDSTFNMINKRRTKPNEIHSMELVGSVENRNVIILDDLIDTGGTLIKAANIIMDNGAKSVRAVATHGVLSGKAIENIENSMLKELLISDTIPNINKKISSKIKYVSCSKLLSSAIKSTWKKTSIHEINSV